MEKNAALVIRHLSNQTFARLLNGEKFEFREPVFFRVDMFEDYLREQYLFQTDENE